MSGTIVLSSIYCTVVRLVSYRVQGILIDTVQITLALEEDIRQGFILAKVPQYIYHVRKRKKAFLFLLL